MLYQTLLVGKNPYIVSAGAATGFEQHRHPEMELSYCLSGSYAIDVENEILTLHRGDLAVIAPMAAHEFPKIEPPTGIRLTIEIGPGFLKEHYGILSVRKFTDKIYRLGDASDPTSRALRQLLEDTARLHENRSEFSELQIQGNLCHISALVLQELVQETGTAASQKMLQDIARIENALRIIHNRYAQPLQLEEVAGICGYSKSNFCKIFKNITGDTFHNALNRHRIEIACMYLRQSELSIEDIAARTGFSDAKSFCRVFRKMLDQSPGQYRKNIAAFSCGE